MGVVLSSLVECGYGVAYRVLNAQFFGVAQRRRRVFVVGHSSGDYRRAAAVLFERQGVRWNSSQERQSGRSPSVFSVGGFGGYRDNGQDDGSKLVVIPIQYAEQWGRDKRQNGTGIGDPGGPSYTLDRSYEHGVMVSHTLRGSEGFDASEDGTGRGVPVFAFNHQSGGSKPRIGGSNEFSDALSRSQTSAIYSASIDTSRMRKTSGVPRPLDVREVAESSEITDEESPEVGAIDALEKSAASQ